jgi:hypothetical protein
MPAYIHTVTVPGPFRVLDQASQMSANYTVPEYGSLELLLNRKRTVMVGPYCWKHPFVFFKLAATGSCIIVYTFRFRKHLCGRVCCGWVWLHYFQRFSEYEQTWPSSSYVVRWKYSCRVRSVPLWSHLANCDHYTFKMNEKCQNKLLRVYQRHNRLLVFHLRFWIAASEGPEGPRRSQGLCADLHQSLSEFLSPVRAWGDQFERFFRLPFGTLTFRQPSNDIKWPSWYTGKSLRGSERTICTSDSASHFNHKHDHTNVFENWKCKLLCKTLYKMIYISVNSKNYPIRLV